MPKGDQRQTMMFSATFPPNIQRLASDFLQDYIYLTVGRVGSASKDVTQTVKYVEERDKMDTLMRLLLTIEDGLILIFVETKRACDYVEDMLCQKGFPACSIHGDKSQREREDALRTFKRGITPVMVATDVASRGLDIPNVTQVVNFDLPTNIDDYVHRIGKRTLRRSLCTRFPSKYL
jgi:ATP-dependent RNA helicase DDX3X